MLMMRLVCFGDSICYGYGARPGTGWAARLATALADLPRPITVVNAGVSGDTTADALRRMREDVEKRLPDAVYVQFGLNDCSFWCGQHGHPWIALDDYLANMREIVDRSFGCGSRMVFVATNHPVGGNPPPFGTSEYQDLVVAYNEALRKTFPPESEQGLFLVDLERLIRQRTDIDPKTLVLDDGVHLSEAGNHLYFELLLPILTDRLLSGQN